MTRKTHKQLFGTQPVPGQSCKFVYVYVFFLSLTSLRTNGSEPGTKECLPYQLRIARLQGFEHTSGFIPLHVRRGASPRYVQALETNWLLGRSKGRDKRRGQKNRLFGPMFP